MTDYLRHSSTENQFVKILRLNTSLFTSKKYLHFKRSVFVQKKLDDFDPK